MPAKSAPATPTPTAAPCSTSPRAPATWTKPAPPAATTTSARPGRATTRLRAWAPRTAWAPFRPGRVAVQGLRLAARTARRQAARLRLRRAIDLACTGDIPRVYVRHEALFVRMEVEDLDLP